MLIKICGMTRQEDLDCARAEGVDFCGFIFAPASPRCIAPEKASSLRTGPMARVGVFTDDNARDILDIMNRAKLDYAQLHGSHSIATALEVGKERVIRVLWPQKYASRADLENAAKNFADSCAYFLLDAGIAGGGSGNVINWSLLADINLPRPWFLAGGLSPNNVAEAMQCCRPDGVDFNSGLEDGAGVKNHGAIKAAARVLREVGRQGKILEEQ